MCATTWKPYLNAIAAEAGQALDVLDRFHITSHLNQAVEEVRRAESGRPRNQGGGPARRLKYMRWPLLRRGSRVRARQKLNALLASKLASVTKRIQKILTDAGIPHHRFHDLRPTAATVFRAISLERRDPSPDPDYEALFRSVIPYVRSENYHRANGQQGSRNQTSLRWPDCR